MTTTERILEHKHANQPFAIHLSDGRKFFINSGDYISLNPSGKGTNVIVYGPGEDEEHFIPYSRSQVYLSMKRPPSNLLNPKSRRSEEHTSELQSHLNLVCRLLLETKNR